jgi:tetraacyldisaccharide 4'-kinase
MDWERLWECQRPPWWLRALAQLYVLGWRGYERLYRWGLKRRAQLPLPVIGVGSVQVGGAGKTPIAIALTQWLRNSGWRVAVLCSGYGGRRFNDITLLEPGTSPDPREVGDEAVELFLALRDVPVGVGRRRVAVARAALERWRPDVLVLDDGFQHLPLARTVDLVVLPAERPFGNGYCLPAGPLREPPDGLQRADAILLTRTANSVPQTDALPRAIPSFEVLIEPEGLEALATGERLPLDALRGQAVVAVSGIARAHRFLQTLERLGMQVAESRTFPDHHPFERETWEWARGKTLIITAKDAPKLRGRLPAECQAYVLRIRAQIEPDFYQWLLAHLPRTV